MQNHQIIVLDTIKKANNSQIVVFRRIKKGQWPYRQKPFFQIASIANNTLLPPKRKTRKKRLGAKNYLASLDFSWRDRYLYFLSLIMLFVQKIF
jgi:hypothetical protein